MNYPFVFINMAMSADGKIASVNHVVSSIGSENDFEHLLALRATADAVMSGARTVNSGNINLGPGPAPYRRLRIKNGLAEYNLRVIVSGTGSINPRAEIFRHRFSPIVILTTARAGRKKLRRLREVADDVHICGEDKIHFHQTLTWLRKAWRIESLLCEGGGELNDALFRAGLVAELNLTVCPEILGGRAAPTIADGRGASRLADTTRLRLKSQNRAGDECFLVYEVVNATGHPVNDRRRIALSRSSEP